MMEHNAKSIPGDESSNKDNAMLEDWFLSNIYRTLYRDPKSIFLTKAEHKSMPAHKSMSIDK